MTDEEKANEYAQKRINIMFVDESEEVYVRASTLKKIFKDSYLKGLIDGRKEVREHETTCINRLHFIEKENAELKKDKEYFDDINNEQTVVILQLNEQIDKMKCCGNCKYYAQENNYIIGTCKRNYSIEGNNICNNWELAE